MPTPSVICQLLVRCQLPLLVICQPLVMTPSPGYLSAISQDESQIPPLVICQPLVRAKPSSGYLSSMSQDGCQIPLLFICQPLIRMNAIPSPCPCQPRSQIGCQSLNLSPCHLSTKQPEWLPVSLLVTCQPSSQNGCQSLFLSPINLAAGKDVNLSHCHLSTKQPE
jgi:hypothetical protein